MNRRQADFSVNIPASDKPRLVIIGGGFGGMNLLKRLSSKDFQIVLVDRYNYHTFQPLLYQVATAGLEPDAVAGPLRKIIDDKKREAFFRMLTVTGIDPSQNKVLTNAGPLRYDYLVIATGSQINYFGDQRLSKHAFPMKQVTHALDLRSHIFQQFEMLEIIKDESEKQHMMNFVIVGAGPTGVELCGALAELKKHILPKDYPELDFSRMQIYLVEGLKQVLPGMSGKSGAKVRAYLERMGIRLILDCFTRSYDGRVVSFNNHPDIETNTLVWAAGVKGKLVGGLADEGIRQGKYRVNGINQVYQHFDDKKTYERIFAIGDVALMSTRDHPEGLPGLAPVAIQQGKHLAGNLSRLIRGREPRPFHYNDKGVMATIGRNRAVADLPFGIHLGGILGWMVWMTIHLLYLVGFRNRAIVLTNWMWNYFTYDRSVRLILRPSTKLKDRISSAMVGEMDESGS